MLLEARHLQKKYSRGGQARTVVNDVNLTLRRGSFVSIVGRSGSGKSTLLNMLAGLLAPTAGEVCFEGKSLLGQSDRQLSRWRNTALGYVPQGASLLGNLSVLDNVRLPFFLGPQAGETDAAVAQRASALLARVGLAEHQHQYPAHLSGGEMRRVAIARALIRQPALLIADEPTADLDIETTRQVMQLFAEVCAQGMAVLMVTHEQETEVLAHQRYVMASGVLELA